MFCLLSPSIRNMDFLNTVGLLGELWLRPRLSFCACLIVEPILVCYKIKVKKTINLRIQSLCDKSQAKETYKFSLEGLSTVTVGQCDHPNDTKSSQLNTQILLKGCLLSL